MPTPKHYKKYPIEFTELLLRAQKNAITMPFETKAEAVSFRRYLYAFREAIEKTGKDENLKFISKILKFKVTGSKVTIYQPITVTKMMSFLNLRKF